MNKNDFELTEIKTNFFKEDYMIVIDDELKEISCSIIDK